MDWLSADYASEIRSYILDYIAAERRRVQQEISNDPQKISDKVREDGDKMRRLITALSPRIEVTG